MFGPALVGGYPGWAAKASARYAIVPWVAVGVSGSYHSGAEDDGRIMTPSHTALGGFVELHFVPGGFVDPWFRFAAGPDLPTGAGADERGVLSFTEWALGLSFGGDTFFVGPYLNGGPILSSGTDDEVSVGLRFDYAGPRDGN